MKSYKIFIQLIAFLGFAMCLSNCTEEDEVTLPEVVASFTQTIEDDQGTVRFLNTSENAKSFEWDFGDGTTSVEENPIKQFATGTYTVTLTATNEADDSKSFSDQITVLVIKSVSLPATFDATDVNYTPNAFGGTAFEVVDNPDQSGSNDKDSKVGAITNSGATFEGIFFNLGTSIDLSENQGIAMNFWADAPVNLLLKLEEGSAADVETTVSHGGTGWERITFNMNGTAAYARFTFFVDGPGTTAGTFYIDDIEQVERVSVVIPPTVSSTAPTQEAASVVSIFSDSFEDTPKTGFNLYGEAVFEQVNFEGNSVLRYATGNNGFQVIELGGDNKIDATAEGMTNFRFDVWFPNEVSESTEFLLKLVNIGDNTSEAEIRISPSSSPAMEQGKWLSYDVVLADLVANTPLEGTSDIQQVVIDLLSAGEVYIDNIYFYASSGGGGGDVDVFCNTSMTHFGGDANSEIVTSIYNIDAQTMRIEVKSADGDAVDDLILPAGDWSPVPGISVAPNDSDNDGTWVAEFFFPDGAPETVDLYFLWSKASFAGNWLSHDFGGAGDLATVAFNAECETGGGGSSFDSGLLTNGDFEDGATPWIVGVNDDTPATVVTEDGNTYYTSGEITSPNPDAAFNVNVSQKLALTDGTTYTLTFDAWSDRSRAIIAGIGRSGGDFANVNESVAITDTRATYTVTLTALGFGEADNRVLFDLNGEAGVVNIDNVSLVEEGSGGGGGETGSSIVDFTFSEATSIDTWMKVADANSDEATITWVSDGGVEGGAMKIKGSNPSDAAGKAYIFQVTVNDLNYDGATDVKLTFDLKLAAPLNAAAVHLQTIIPGIGATNNFDLQSGGLNDASFTSYSFDFSGVEAGANTFTMHFNFASGNVVGAGGELLIDNIKLVKSN